MAHQIPTGTAAPDTVVIDGLLWAPIDGAAPTAQEFAAAAQSLFLDLNDAAPDSGRRRGMIRCEHVLQQDAAPACPQRGIDVPVEVERRECLR